VGTIKSLCYALKKPIIGVSTLAAIAYNLRCTNGLICPILDARKNEVYGAVFRGGKNFVQKSDELCVPIEAFFDHIDEPAVFVGDGLQRYASAVQERFGEDAVLAEAIFNVPRGANIAQIGCERLLNGQSDDYFSLTPNYVRKGVT
jgi:tRNA threonylcarbamoyladenosine biosynthesis protein TsaB